MTSRYDICTGRKDRDGKMQYHKIGAMFPSKKGEGFAIKLNSLPLPNEQGECWMAAFVPRDRDDGQSSQQRQPSRAPAGGSARLADAIDDDIPFAMEWR